MNPRGDIPMKKIAAAVERFLTFDANWRWE